jgi:hypothetical protein
MTHSLNTHIAVFLANFNTLSLVYSVFQKLAKLEWNTTSSFAEYQTPYGARGELKNYFRSYSEVKLSYNRVFTLKSQEHEIVKSSHIGQTFRYLLRLFISSVKNTVFPSKSKISNE